MGFKVTGPRIQDKKNCYCPCGRHMDPWREHLFLNGIAGRGSPGFCGKNKGSRVMLPSVLMAHLYSYQFKQFPVHFGVKEYVWALYKNYHKGSGNKVE